jgi:hypothetical protein
MRERKWRKRVGSSFVIQKDSEDTVCEKKKIEEV